MKLKAIEFVLASDKNNKTQEGELAKKLKIDFD